MKKFTKKQMIATGAVAILGIGGISTGVFVHNSNVHDQQVAKTKAHEAKVKADKKAKAEQLAKEKEAAQQKEVATLLATATKNPSDTSIKAVSDAIAKLIDQKEKTKDVDLVKGLNNRLALIKKAQSTVKDYQAHATDANKQKLAQAAINALTDKNDASVKAQLQKLFDDSNKQAKEVAKSTQSKQGTAPTASNSSNQDNQGTGSNVSNNANSNTQYSAPATNANSNIQYNAPATNTNRQYSAPATNNNSNIQYNAPATNTPSNGSASSNNNTNTNSQNNSSSTPSTPVSHVYQAVCYGNNGQTISSQNFGSQNEAVSWAVSFGNSHLDSVYGYKIIQLS